MSTEIKKQGTEIIQVLKYSGMDLYLCIEPDGNAAVYSMPGMVLVFRGDVISQCWHLAKWQIRCNLTRVKLMKEERKRKAKL
jgi:hypothetical protein